MGTGKTFGMSMMTGDIAEQWKTMLGGLSPKVNIPDMEAEELVCSYPTQPMQENSKNPFLRR